MRRDPNSISDYRVEHPGKALQQFLDDRPMTVNELSRRTMLSEELINRILSGEKNVNANIAKKLEFGTGVAYEYWMMEQALYDERQLLISEREDICKEEIQILNLVRDEVRIMQENGIMFPYEDDVSIVMDLRRVLQLWNLTYIFFFTFDTDDQAYIDFVRKYMNAYLKQKEQQDATYNSRKRKKDR